jgi:hypothetical protein
MLLTHFTLDLATDASNGDRSGGGYGCSCSKTQERTQYNVLFHRVSFPFVLLLGVTKRSRLVIPS